MTDHDFGLFTHKWNTSRRLFDSQVQKLQASVEKTHPDAIVIMNIPRHHAKKFTQASDWTKDYFLSKESRSITEGHQVLPEGSRDRSAPTPITLVFSRFPPTSEQWFATDVTDKVSAEPAGFAHVVEICIGLNAWHPTRCPLGLLQEYQLSYDEVSTMTLVIASQITDELKHSFSTESVGNSVILIAPDVPVEPQLRTDCWHLLGANSLQEQTALLKFSFILGENLSEGEEET